MISIYENPAGATSACTPTGSSDREARLAQRSGSRRELHDHLRAIPPSSIILITSVIRPCARRNRSTTALSSSAAIDRDSGLDSEGR